jgi:hypothetical protein
MSVMVRLDRPVRERLAPIVDEAGRAPFLAERLER